MWTRGLGHEDTIRRPLCFGTHPIGIHAGSHSHRTGFKCSSLILAGSLASLGSCLWPRLKHSIELLWKPEDSCLLLQGLHRIAKAGRLMGDLGGSAPQLESKPRASAA